MNVESGRRPHTASVNVSVGETVAFNVLYKPTAVQRSQAHVRVSVIDNQYEDSVVQLVGEGYEDEITLDRINSVEASIDPESEEGNMAEDDVSGEICVLYNCDPLCDFGSKCSSDIMRYIGTLIKNHTLLVSM